MAKLFDIMGNFPFKPEDKKPMLIRKQDYSTASVSYTHLDVYKRQA